MNQQCLIKYFNSVIKSSIQELLACSCMFFLNSSIKGKDMCLHKIWVLVNYFGVSEKNLLVHQEALTKGELEKIFSGTPNVEVLSP